MCSVAPVSIVSVPVESGCPLRSTVSTAPLASVRSDVDVGPGRAIVLPLAVALANACSTVAVLAGSAYADPRGAATTSAAVRAPGEARANSRVRMRGRGVDAGACDMEHLVVSAARAMDVFDPRSLLQPVAAVDALTLSLLLARRVARPQAAHPRPAGRR